MSLNSVSLSGNIAQEPKLSQTKTGTEMLTFSIAVRESYKDSKTGEWQSRPNFFDCVMWGLRATSVSRYLSKGAKVSVHGRLKQNSWTAEDGTKRHSVTVVLDDIDFTGNAKGAPSGTEAERAAQPEGQPAPVDLYDEEMPF